MRNLFIKETPIKDLYLIYPDGKPYFPNAITVFYNGEEKFVIDLGMKLEELDEKLKYLNTGLEDVDYVIITHFHPDHNKGTWRIKEKAKKAQIWLNHKEAQYITSWDSFFDAYGFKNRRDLQEEWLATVGNPLDFKPYKPDREIKPYERETIGDAELEFIPTYGHTLGHTAVKIGDLIVTGDIDLTNFPWYGHPTSSLEGFVESLKLLLKLKPKYIVTMHRGLIYENIEYELHRYLNIVIERDKRIVEAIHNYDDLEKLFELNIIYPRYDYMLARFFEEEMIKHHMRYLCKKLKEKLSVLEGVK